MSTSDGDLPPAVLLETIYAAHAWEGLARAAILPRLGLAGGDRARFAAARRLCAVLRTG